MNQHTRQPKGSAEKSDLTEFSEAEQQLAELLTIQQAVQSIAEKLKGMIEQAIKKTVPMA
ncbi:hypothetical protein A3860_02445 [Niastella vici]|uniref:Uncharacterized protein n=1 Tax=Niastella vici TaxID=1703345 RepID=A0A1V9G9B1_9BACT|nr:hypothetical protein [Niastella vici]OQP67239.1 hypothetical protein A3860_02445 [Niastella vici]